MQRVNRWRQFFRWPRLNLLVCSHTMARPNYSGEKRRKELEKQKKKEEKKRRKLENASLPASGEEAVEASEPPQQQPTGSV